MPTDRELYTCRECRIWDPDNQPSVARELERNPNAYKDRWFAWVKTPNFAYGQQLYVELVLCKEHEEG
jgi:hypothetical protein